MLLFFYKAQMFKMCKWKKRNVCNNQPPTLPHFENLWVLWVTYRWWHWNSDKKTWCSVPVSTGPLWSSDRTLTEQTHSQSRALQLRRRFLTWDFVRRLCSSLLEPNTPSCSCPAASLRPGWDETQTHICLKHIQKDFTSTQSMFLTKGLPNVRTVSEPRWAVAPPLPTTHSRTDCSATRHVSHIYTVIQEG